MKQVTFRDNCKSTYYIQFFTIETASGDDFIVNIGYWSSTEISANLALSKDLSDGGQVGSGNGKTDLYFIRAIRDF